MRRPTLIVFARSPAIGVGKTRLAKDIGAVEAWRVYRAMAARLLWRLRDPRWRLVVRLAGSRRDPAWPAVGILDQGRGDLGVKLERALADGGDVAVIGTDAPDVTPARIWRAFRAPAAIGPARDGGFWLLSLPARRAGRLRLDGVRWSTRHAAADAARAVGQPLVWLETLDDIDTGADLARRRRR